MKASASLFLQKKKKNHVCIVLFKESSTTQQSSRTNFLTSNQFAELCVLHTGRAAGRWCFIFYSTSMQGAWLELGLCYVRCKVSLQFTAQCVAGGGTLEGVQNIVGQNVQSSATLYSFRHHCTCGHWERCSDQGMCNCRLIEQLIGVCCKADV